MLHVLNEKKCGEAIVIHCRCVTVVLSLGSEMAHTTKGSLKGLCNYRLKAHSLRAYLEIFCKMSVHKKKKSQSHARLLKAKLGVKLFCSKF